MSARDGEWFVSRGGDRFGPVTFQDLVDGAKAGRLEPRTDLIYGGDLEDWTPAGDVEGVFEKVEVEATASTSTGQQSLAATGSYEEAEAPVMMQLPGAPRLGYFLGVVVLPLILVIGLGKVMPELQGYAGEKAGPWLPLLIFVVPMLVTILVTVKRFQNLAMSGWWFFGLMVPLMNLWLSYRLFACPPGYAYTKKLDGIGVFLALLFWGVLIASLVVPILFAAQMTELINSEQFQEYLRQAQELTPEVPEVPEAPQR